MIDKEPTMNRRFVLAFASALVISAPSIALAHVSVRPRESSPSIEERYTVRVPTEGTVSTVSVRFEIPEGVTVVDVERVEGATYEMQKNGSRIIAITWQKPIEPKAAAEFFFRARNPLAGTEIVWKAHQHFADGTVADWIEPAGGKRPAPVTKLVSAATPQAAGSEAASIEAWLRAYDAAFLAKDLEKLATFYHPDVTIYEGTGINNGWADYRDHHLGPELKSFENLQFGHTETKVTVLPGGESAYATSHYTIKARMGERQLDSEGLESLVLMKTAEGWRIRHSHTSGRARRPAP
jgi:uncharacterized protein YcnI